MTEIDSDMHLCHRLAQHLRRHPVEIVGQVFGGTTDRVSRRERLRKLITEHKMAVVVMGKHNGKSDTYAQYFERVYGEALTSEKHARKSA